MHQLPQMGALFQLPRKQNPSAPYDLRAANDGVGADHTKLKPCVWPEWQLKSSKGTAEGG